MTAHPKNRSLLWLLALVFPAQLAVADKVPDDAHIIDRYRLVQPYQHATVSGLQATARIVAPHGELTSLATALAIGDDLQYGQEAADIASRIALSYGIPAASNGETSDGHLELAVDQLEFRVLRDQARTRMKIMDLKAGPTADRSRLNGNLHVALDGSASFSVGDKSYGKHRITIQRLLPSDFLVSASPADFQKLKDELLESLAVQGINEYLMLWHPPPSKPDSPYEYPRKGGVPEYALAPKNHRVRITLWPGKIPVALGVKSIEVSSVQPVLQWEAFPRDFDRIVGNAEAEYSDVTYELRIFAAWRGGNEDIDINRMPNYIEGPVYARDGLTEQQHKIEEPLDHCAQYFWTVRARFKLAGLPRVTEWSGANTRGFNVRPWMARLNWPQKSHLQTRPYLVHTPVSPYARKCNYKR